MILIKASLLQLQRGCRAEGNEGLHTHNTSPTTWADSNMPLFRGRLLRQRHFNGGQLNYEEKFFVNQAFHT